MPQHPPQPAVTVEITASTAGTLMLRHRITTDPAGGPDLLCLNWEIRPDGAVPDGSTPVGDVDALVETDDEALTCSLLGLDRADVGTLIRYLTGVEAGMAGAA